MLDLFSGDGSVAKRLSELGYEVVTVDINPRHRPSIVVDIIKWRYQETFPKGHFDLIVGRIPPEALNYFQRKNVVDHYGQMANRFMEIVKYFGPKRWWMEVEVDHGSSSRPTLKKLPFCEVDYCKFSKCVCSKRVRIFGSTEIGTLSSVLCTDGSCPNILVTWDGKREHKDHCLWDN